MGLIVGLLHFSLRYCVMKINQSLFVSQQNSKFCIKVLSLLAFNGHHFFCNFGKREWKNNLYGFLQRNHIHQEMNTTVLVPKLRTLTKTAKIHHSYRIGCYDLSALPPLTDQAPNQLRIHQPQMDVPEPPAWFEIGQMVDSEFQKQPSHKSVYE